MSPIKELIKELRILIKHKSCDVQVKLWKIKLHYFEEPNVGYGKNKIREKFQIPKMLHV